MIPDDSFPASFRKSPTDAGTIYAEQRGAHQKRHGELGGGGGFINVCCVVLVHQIMRTCRD